MKIITFLAVILCIFQYALASYPIGNCQGGRAVPYTMSASGGTCNIPIISGIPVANVDEKFFNNGQQCGKCYEVSGPLGVKIVQVVDSCASITGTNTCTGDVTQFGLDEISAFSVIADRNSTDIIYDLGFREVTCEVTGNVQFIVSSLSNYYFQLQVWNFRVGLDEIRIKGSGWSDYNSLSRQGSSGIWSWNKANDNLVFPLSIYLVGSTNELIFKSFSSFSDGSTVDFGDQFTNVDETTNTCPMSISPSVVYNDVVGYGWNTDYSFRPNIINTSYSINPFSGSFCIYASLYDQGGLLFTRTGGFNPQYFSHLTFAARADENTNIKVYLGDGLSLSSTQSITTSWQIFNISVSSLSLSQLESDLVFMNINGALSNLYFDSISWEISSTSPLDNVTQVTTSGGYNFNSSSSSGIILVTTGTTGNFSFDSESSENNPSSTTGSKSTSSSSSFIINKYFSAFIVASVIILHL